MSDLPSHIPAFRDAINTGDVDQAVATYETLAQTSLETLLAQLETAVEEQRYSDAKTLFDQIIRQYESRRRERTATTARIEGAQTAEETDFGTIQDISEYLSLAGETDVVRSDLLASVQGLIKAKTSDTRQSPRKDQSATVETIQQTRQQEQNLQQGESTVMSDVDSISIPPSLAITDVTKDPQAPTVGTPITIEITLQNVGDSEARDVELSVSTPSTLTTSQSTVSVGRIGAGSESTATLRITGQSSGTYSVMINVRGSDGTEASETLTATITSPSNLPSNLARFDTTGNGKIGRREVIDAIVAFNADSTIGGQPVTRSDVIDVIVEYNA